MKNFSHFDSRRISYKGGRGDLFSLSAQYLYGSEEKIMIEKDDELIDLYPFDATMGERRYVIINENGSRSIKYINRDNVIKTFLSNDLAVDYKGLVLITNSTNSRGELCRRISESPSDDKFRFNITYGWNSKKVYTSCIDSEMIDLNLTLILTIVIFNILFYLLI